MIEYTSKKNGQIYKLCEGDIILRNGEIVKIQYFKHSEVPVLRKGVRIAKKLKDGYEIRENKNGIPMVVKGAKNE